MEAGKVSIKGTDGGSNEVPARALKKCKDAIRRDDCSHPDTIISARALVISSSQAGPGVCLRRFFRDFSSGKISFYGSNWLGQSAGIV